MNITTHLQEESSSLRYNGDASQKDINYVSCNYLKLNSAFIILLKRANFFTIHKRFVSRAWLKYCCPVAEPWEGNCGG